MYREKAFLIDSDVCIVFANMHKKSETKKARNWSHDAREGQQRNPNEVTSGVTARDTEGAQEKEKLQEESVPATNVQANNRVNISLGHSDLCVEGGGFGPEATWPNSCCCY